MQAVHVIQMINCIVLFPVFHLFDRALLFCAQHAVALQAICPQICFLHDMLAVALYVFDRRTAHVQRTHKTISIAFYACDQTYLICGDPSFLRWCPPLFARNIFDLFAFMAFIEVFFIYLSWFR